VPDSSLWLLLVNPPLDCTITFHIWNYCTGSFKEAQPASSDQATTERPEVYVRDSACCPRNADCVCVCVCVCSRVCVAVLVCVSLCVCERERESSTMEASWGNQAT